MGGSYRTSYEEALSFLEDTEEVELVKDADIRHPSLYAERERCKKIVRMRKEKGIK